MKKLIFLLMGVFFLYADNSKLIKNLIGPERFNTYYELLKPVLNETSLEKTLKYLQNNGLLDIFFDKPRLIHPTFIFKNSNPIFNTVILYKTLDSLGYYYFYPVNIIKKQTTYKLTLEMKSTHFIDPLLFTNTISQYGCKILNIKKEKNYTYTLNCTDETLDTLKVINKKTKLLNAKGVYWINPNGYDKISVTSSKFDNWYPYVVFYDANLNILNIISDNNPQKSILLKVPAECRYIKITDNFSKENFKRGIYIKGIK
jgi:hypothetical protein